MVLTRLIVAVVLVAAVLTACGKADHRPAQQTIEEGWTEPMGAGIGTVDMLVRYPKNLRAIVDYADVIVSGDIVSINDTSKTFKMQEGTPEREVSEKMGAGSTFDVIGKDIVIAVSDTLKGTIEGNEVTLNIYNVSASLDPEVQVGHSYIFFLVLDEKNGVYHPAHFSAGYIRIDKAKDEVHPLYLEANDFSDLQNKPYAYAKKKIMKLAKA